MTLAPYTYKKVNTCIKIFQFGCHSILATYKAKFARMTAEQIGAALPVNDGFLEKWVPFLMT